jgi:DNA-binding CsgD family transcriptional regulator
MLDALASSGLQVALDHIGSPAFVTDGGGRPVYSNGIGARLFDRDPAGMTKNLQRRLTARDVREITAPGLRPHWFVVLSPEADVPDERVARAALQWKLTKRQGEVLALAVKGEANKTIASLLGCAVATVEVHMSAILRKTALDNRAQLVSRFWTL